MYPKVKFIKGSSGKKLFCFLGDPLLFEQCKKKNSPCGLIANGLIIEGDDSMMSPEMIASLAVEIWRLEKRLNNVKVAMIDKIGSDIDPVFDQMQRLKDCLAKYEIETKEHTGETYNDGLSLKALHFETDENLPKGVMRIIETVKPSVFLKGSVILHGEVIVARSKEI